MTLVLCYVVYGSLHIKTIDLHLDGEGVSPGLYPMCHSKYNLGVMNLRRFLPDARLFEIGGKVVEIQKRTMWRRGFALKHLKESEWTRYLHETACYKSEVH